MGYLVIIEGNIGAGKSTLSEQLAGNYCWKLYKEPVEENPYLEKFYKDPKTYALPMQYWLLSRRFEMHQEALKYVWASGNCAIFDRSVYGDAVFCEKNYQDGNIDWIGYQSYIHMRNVMTRFLMIPQITIYLDVSPEKCQERIKMRNRDCETEIPIPYLSGLSVLYEKLLRELKEKGSNIVRVDWNEFKTLGEVVTAIEKQTNSNMTFWGINANQGL